MSWKTNARMVLAVLVLAALLSGAACSSASSAASKPQAGAAAPAAGAGGALFDPEKAKAEGTTVGIGTFLDSQVAALRQGFEAKYGVRIEFSHPTSSETVTRLLAEASSGRMRNDWVIVSDDGMKVLNEQGLLDPLPQEILDRYPEKWRGPDGAWIVYELYAWGILYNNKLVSPDAAPKNLDDLASPQWKGKLALVDPRQALSALAWAKGWYETMGDAETDDLLRRFAANDPRYFDSPSRLASGMVQQQFAVGTGNLTHELSVGGAGGDLTAVAIQPTYANLGAFALLKNRPHPQAGLALADYLNSPEFLRNDAALGYPVTQTQIPRVVKALQGVDIVPMPTFADQDEQNKWREKVRADLDR